ncbi:potassium voltage-gated channel subfamily H member 6-like isoform X2 [Actinia tenebrosa]|uniref:Potassium voltage-gated channel subfamily H member 6-like isoform X2 n=1 Tax=Actinia tenebrosa TaxID=6105 RepID=A0A6P8HPJ3_ACTTE|nr:potassium voltage-gated channel subfamily H member 6-like isoform X2 [Actinia tenebrosa]
MKVRESGSLSLLPEMAEPSELEQLSSNARAKLQGRNLPKYVILHNSKFKASWDWFVLALVIYTAIEIPYTAAFGQLDKTKRISPLGQLKNGRYLAISNVVVDCLFIVDILINFRSTYTRKGTDELVVDPRMIACNYLKTWFVIDLLAAIPFEFFVSQGTEGTASLAGLLKSARLLRLVRVSRKLDRYSEYGLAVVVLLTCLFTLVAHWLACIWHFIGISQITLPHGWITVLSKQMNSSYDPSYSSLPDLTTRYISSLYFTLTSLTSIGFGNVSPNTNSEKIFAVVMMLVGALMYAAIFGNMTAIIQRLYTRTARYHRDMKVIKEFIRFHNIPENLQGTLTEYFTHEWSAQKDQQLNQVLQRFPESLQADICVQIHREVFSRCPVFENMSDSCLRALSVKFDIMNYLPSYFIIKEGDLAKYIYFFALGTVDVIKDGGSVSILGQGDSVGGDYMSIKTKGNLKADATLMARTFTEVHYVAWSDVFSVAEAFPEIEEAMCQYLYTLDIGRCNQKGGGLVGQGPWSALALGAPIGISLVNIADFKSTQSNSKEIQVEADVNKNSNRKSPRPANPTTCMNGSIGETPPQTLSDKHLAWTLNACQRIETLEKRLVNVESKIQDILDILIENRAENGRKKELRHKTTYL